MMKPKYLTGLAAGLILLLGTVSGVLAYSENHPVGTTLYKPDKAWNGYLLTDVEVVTNDMVSEGTYTKLVDMNGNEVHRWNNTLGMPSKMLPDGNILTNVGNWANGSQDGMFVQQMDWDGKVLWSFNHYASVSPIEGEPVTDGKSWVARQHHDLERQGAGPYYYPGAKPVAQGNTLILGHTNREKA